MPLSEQLYTKSTFLSLSGASGIVFVLTNTVIYLVPSAREIKIVPLLAAALVSFTGLFFIEKVTRSDKILAFFNTFLIFLTAVGINVITSEPPSQTLAYYAPKNGVESPTPPAQNHDVPPVGIPPTAKPKYFYRWYG